MRSQPGVLEVWLAHRNGNTRIEPNQKIVVEHPERGIREVTYDELVDLILPPPREDEPRRPRPRMPWED